jgi:hypothetical protein
MNNINSIPNEAIPVNKPAGSNSGTGNSETGISWETIFSPIHDLHDQRQAAREARREARQERIDIRYTSKFGGVLIIVLGMVFLLQNFSVINVVNWWALFILIPGFWALLAAWNNYQINKGPTRVGIISLTLGVLLITFSLGFLLNLNNSLFGPALLMMGGLILIVEALFPKDERPMKE